MCIGIKKALCKKLFLHRDDYITAVPPYFVKITLFVLLFQKKHKIAPELPVPSTLKQL